MKALPARHIDQGITGDGSVLTYCGRGGNFRCFDPEDSTCIRCIQLHSKYWMETAIAESRRAAAQITFLRALRERRSA